MKEKDIIAQIRGLQADEITTWIDNRIAELERTTPEDRDNISTFEVNARRARGEKENTEVHGFIPCKTRIKKMMFDIASFKLDDKSFYETIVNYIRNTDEKMSNNNNYIMHLIQLTLINYFGERGFENRRNALYNTKDIDDDELSISDFRRNGTAMCVERSAVGQNILAFLGYDPMLIYGYMSSNKGITNEAHAYNCIIRNGKALLIDFTNPLCKDGKYYRPACFPVSSEHLASFMKGKAQLEVQHKDLYTQNGTVNEDVIYLVYASEEINPKYFKNKKTTITPAEAAMNALKGTSTGKAYEAKGVEQSKINPEQNKEGETKDD